MHWHFLKGEGSKIEKKVVTGKCKQVGLGRIYVVKIKIIFFLCCLKLNYQKLVGSTDLDRGLIVAKGMVTVCSCNDDYSYGSQFLRRFNIFSKNG